METSREIAEEALARLRVVYEGDGLTVDAEAVMRTPNDVRYWRLYQADPPDGTWSHYPSATSGPLGRVLFSIALSYTVPTGRPGPAEGRS